jgi:hypothetical protein
VRKRLAATLSAWVIFAASCSSAYAVEVCSTAAQNGARLYQAYGQVKSAEDLYDLYYSVAKSGLPTAQITALLRGLQYLVHRTQLGERAIDIQRFARAIHNTCVAVEVPDYGV